MKEKRQMRRTQLTSREIMNNDDDCDDDKESANNTLKSNKLHTLELYIV